MTLKCVIATFIIVLVGFVQPSFGLVDVVYTSQFDADGQLTSYAGEELAISLTISPGTSPVNDVEITVVSGNDALIDYSAKSFEESTVPAAEIELQKVEGTNKRTYTTADLDVGQELTLNFRAYPKTLMENEIQVAKVTISYIQLGDRLSDDVFIVTNTSDSSWHKLDSAEKTVVEAEQKAAEAEQKAVEAEQKAVEAEQKADYYLYAIVGIVFVIILLIILKLYSVYKY